jgi:hypothetical protein
LRAISKLDKDQQWSVAVVLYKMRLTDAHIG